MNDEVGYLIVSVSSAGGNFPIEGARVRVYSQANEKELELLYTLITDSSGRTPIISLAAPPFYASQSPDTGVIPYSYYTIDTDYEGYYSVQNINAPVYPGVTSIQNVLLIPETYGVTPNEDTRFNESESPDL